MHRFLALALALLIAGPAAAQQVTPSFGIDSAGTLRNLSVRDPTLGSSADSGRTPIGAIDTTSHLFYPAAQLATVTTAANYHPNFAPAYIRTQGYSAVGTGGALYRKEASQPTHPYRFSITDAAGATVWYGIAPSERPVNFEQLGAIGDDANDDTAIVQSALAGGIWPVSGLGKSYRVSGNSLLSNGTVLQDVTFIQTSTTSSRTLTACGNTSCAGPFTLRRIKIDYTAQPITAGSISDHAGIYLTDTVNLRMDDIEVTGNGAGTGIYVIRATGARIINPWVHDLEWSAATDPGIERLQGLRCSDCTDTVIVNPVIENLAGSIPWAASTSLVGLQGKAWRTNAGNAYRAQTNVTTGTTPPTCTSGSCSDGGVTWDYMGPAATTKRNYQADGLSFSGSNHVSVYGGIISHTGQGSDASGGGINNDLWFYGTIYKDLDSWGQKWAHSPMNSGSIGCRVYRAGLGAFTITGGTGADTASPQHMRLVNAWAFDTGSNGNWGTRVGFQNSGGTITPLIDVQLVNTMAVDTQAVPTMAWGYINQTDPLSQDGMILVNPAVVGATVADYVGVTALVRQTALGLDVAGQTEVVNTSAGAAAVALAINNWSNVANSETVMDLAPNKAGIGGRSAQIASVTTTSSDANLMFRTANANVPNLVASFGPSGGGKGGFMVGSASITDPGHGSIHVQHGVQLGLDTVATLPTCNAALEGMMRAVINANSTTYNAVVAAGGTNHMPVYCNGTNWVLH